MSEKSTEKNTRLIKSKATELGFFSCGISKAEFLEEDAPRLKEWLQNKQQAGMSYMENYFEKRTNPKELFENAKSVISVLYNYFPKEEIPVNDNYKISRYAYGKDYHYIMKRKLKDLIHFIESQLEIKISGRVFVDSAPVLERAWAAKSGLGWIGKNTNLITREQGSYFFIGEIITDVELEYDEQVIPNHCGGCTRCIDACPTKALSPYQLDANKCISYWTIEHKGDTILEKFKGKFDDWIFGCDICQEVCPWNRFSEPHNEPGFIANKELLRFKKTDWDKMDQDKFNEIFKESPVKRTLYSGIKRNITFNNPT